jgi:ABC-type transporter Mla subunit MlaD
MVGSAYGFGSPTINPLQPTPWGLSPYSHGSQTIGPASPTIQQTLAFIQSLPQQLQSLQQLTYQQQQQLQQIQQLLAFLPHQLQQAVQQIAYLTSHQLFQHASAPPSVGHVGALPFGATSPSVAMPFQSAFGPQVPPQPSYLM